MNARIAQHNVLLNMKYCSMDASVHAQKGQRYPICVEGERACPPEGVGGVRGYAEKFDADKATKAMRLGPPDWRGAWPEQ